MMDPTDVNNNPQMIPVGNVIQFLTTKSEPPQLAAPVSGSVLGPDVHFYWHDLDDYVVHGGYPGAAHLITEPDRWARYIRQSLIETSISRDVLLLTRVDKPALLRRLFELGCRYSGQVLSYTKILGQLQDAGNTTTLAHYLDLLAAAGMMTGIQKYAGSADRRRGSSPKFQVLNTGLMTATLGFGPNEAKSDPQFWARLTESAVGAHFATAAAAGDCELFYWRDGIPYQASKPSQPLSSRIVRCSLEDL